MSQSKSKDQRLMEQVDQIDALKQAQLSGNVKKVKGNVVSEYELPENEAHLIHLEAVTFIQQINSRTNKERKRTLKFDVRQFEKMEKNNHFAQFAEINLLHDPRQVKKEDPKKDEEDESTKELRATYKKLTGKNANKNWKVETLQEKIDELSKAKEDGPTKEKEGDSEESKTETKS